MVLNAGNDNAANDGGVRSDALRDSVARNIEELISWAATLTVEAIPVSAWRRMAMIIGDDIAAIVASQGEPEVQQAQTLLLDRALREEATVFRTGRPRADRWNAAVANAIAADWAELDEGYRKATCHAGLYTLPALLAEAEATGATLAEVFRAGIAAYEITTRFARTWTFPALTLHPHAIFNAVGAAASVGLLRRLSAADLLSAVTAASTLVSVGPYDHAVRGALVRNVWAAAGAWSGMQAVDWARCGIAGLAASPYDVYARGLGAETRPGQLTAALGREWAVEDGYHKVHACCQYAHSAIEAVLDVIEAAPQVRDADAVDEVIVETHPLGMTLTNRNPATSLAAKFSLPHAVAATLAFGSSGPAAFSVAALNRPDVSELRHRVRLVPHPAPQPWPLDRPARVTVALKSGEKVTRECPSARGGPDRPFGESELFQKMRTLSAGVLPRLAEGISALADAGPDGRSRPWGAWVREFYGDESR